MSWSCLIAVVRVRGFALCHDEVKRAVRLFTGFAFVIASAPGSFLYLKQRIHDMKKKEMKKSEKKAPKLPHALRPLHLQSLKLQLHVV